VLLTFNGAALTLRKLARVGAPDYSTNAIYLACLEKRGSTAIQSDEDKFFQAGEEIVLRPHPWPGSAWHRSDTREALPRLCMEARSWDTLVLQ
jgi:hypothetical protein